jgi:hypothetical protein
MTFDIEGISAWRKAATGDGLQATGRQAFDLGLLALGKSKTTREKA